MEELLVKVVVWYSIQNGGDGSASPNWWLTEEEASWEQENMDEGWGEECSGSVETFVGSDIYNKAVKSRKEAQKDYYFKDESWEGRFAGDYGAYYKYQLTPEEEEQVGMKFLESKDDSDDWDEDEED